MTVDAEFPGLAALSPREREVLRQLAAGATHDAIANRMNLSRHTVDTYLRRIRAKTGARARVALLMLAIAVAKEPIAAAKEPIAVPEEEPPPA